MGSPCRKTVQVVIETLGCKLNQAETEQLTADLVQAGCTIVLPGQPADLHILNTCTVTHIADRKSRHFIRLARRMNPYTHVVVTGCYAEQSPEEVASIQGVDLVIGNDRKSNLVEILKSTGYIPANGSIDEVSKHRRTRAFIKAQDGCNNACSYCVVPLVRGPEKSVPPEKVIGAIKSRVDTGFHEVVLTGTEIGRYNSDGQSIRDLLARILRETQISRLRLTSLQPEEINSELIDLWKDHRLCRHFHISLQSGSDSVLMRMNRHYSVRDYSEKIELLRRRMPDTAITTDVIVGFPGETDREFKESFAFCRDLEFSRLHIFPFSPRKGTLAAVLPGQVSTAIKKERSQKMIELAEKSGKAFCNRFIGSSAEVLFEHTAEGLWTGLTGNYIKVGVQSKNDLSNHLANVNLLELKGEGLLGEVLNQQSKK